jgi:hypothetical protein
MTRDQLYFNFISSLKIRTRDLKLSPLRFNEPQRLIWEKFAPHIGRKEIRVLAAGSFGCSFRYTRQTHAVKGRQEQEDKDDHRNGERFVNLISGRGTAEALPEKQPFSRPMADPGRVPRAQPNASLS